MRLLRIAQSNTQRLLVLVNDILDIAAIEGETIAFDFQQAEINRLVEGAVLANNAFAEKCGVTIKLEDRTDGATVHTDTKRLEQVVTNLLSNAVKFSPRGEDVGVTIEATDDRVRVYVRDHGPGIPDEYKYRIFEKFVQVDATDTRQNGGSGLGLSIVKQLIVRLGGEVSHEAAPGGGSIFRIDLPRADASAATGTTHHHDPDNGSKRDHSDPADRPRHRVATL
jgi:signal transduction histidine kinase